MKYFTCIHDHTIDETKLEVMNYPILSSFILKIVDIIKVKLTLLRKV